MFTKDFSSSGWLGNCGESSPQGSGTGQGLQGQGDPLSRMLQRRWRHGGGGHPGVIKSAEAQEQKFCDTFLAKSGEDLKDQGLDADWVCQDGAPAREIIAFAQDKGYDLIVMGTHGAGEVAWYMGGVADKVASHATVPVLLFRTLEFKPPLMKEMYFTVPGVG